MALSDHIYWDGFGLESVNSGIYNHARHLLKELGQLDLKPTIYSFKRLSKDLRDLAQVEFIPTPMAPRLLTTKPIWNWRSASFLAKKSNAKIVHGLANVNLPFENSKRFKKIITVHDVIPLLAPQGVSKSYYWQFKVLLPQAIKQADRVICVSDWTQKMLAERFPESAAKLVVIKNGCGKLQLSKQTAVASEVINLLMISRFETYKRFDRYCHLLRSYPDRLLGTIVTDDRGEAWLQKYASDLIHHGQLRIIKHLSSEEISNCYHSCDVYVHTSQFEGFCLPVNEALCHGRPVVYQLGSGMDEVVNPLMGAGLRAEASGEEWFEAIENSYRKLLRNNWLEQVSETVAASYSWKNAADSLKSLYNQMI